MIDVLWGLGGMVVLLGLAALLYAGAFLLGPKMKAPVPVG